MRVDTSKKDFGSDNIQTYNKILKVQNKWKKDRERSIKCYIKLRAKDGEGKYISLEKQDAVFEHIVKSFKGFLEAEINLEALRILCKKKESCQNECWYHLPKKLLFNLLQK